MHTTCRFLYSKGKIHTSYFRKTECETARPAFVRVDNLVCNKGKDELLGGLQCMIVSQKHKSGVTLMEVMAVVAIMGILSGLGVAGLRSAVANARIKDAAYNVTAFMERAANDARRLNTPLCVKRDGENKLVIYKSVCTATQNAEKIDELKLDSPTKLINSTVTSAKFKDAENKDMTNWYDNGADFTPRVGLSAAPSAGYYAVQYGGQGLYGAALKSKTKNSFEPMMKFDEGSWSKL